MTAFYDPWSGSVRMTVSAVLMRGCRGKCQKDLKEASAELTPSKAKVTS